mmetsp:Transcript_5166/g.11076  ORF Transcript_5166/g.11076 Transcript_5166/m.11076 type:complete len:239 (-) Transcript_5166:10-726(-)
MNPFRIAVMASVPSSVSRTSHVSGGMRNCETFLDPDANFDRHILKHLDLAPFSSAHDFESRIDAEDKNEETVDTSTCISDLRVFNTWRSVGNLLRTSSLPNAFFESDPTSDANSGLASFSDILYDFVSQGGTFATFFCRLSLASLSHGVKAGIYSRRRCRHKLVPSEGNNFNIALQARYPFCEFACKSMSKHSATIDFESAYHAVTPGSLPELSGRTFIAMSPDPSRQSIVACKWQST